MSGRQVPSDVYDVIVFGSGSAGLAAALRTSTGGLKTLLAEKTSHLGGTTALSGAGTWVPANHHALAQGVDDSAEQALAYIRAASPQGWREVEDVLWRRFVEQAPAMLRFLENHSPLRFDLVPEGDPYPLLPGAKAFGRMLTPRPLRRGLLGTMARRMRSAMLPQIFTYQEAQFTDLYRRPLRVSIRLAPKLLVRLLTGARARGFALVTGLTRACLDQGCAIAFDTRLVELRQDEMGRVTGAIVETGGQRRTIEARHGVVLATGGFEWDGKRLAQHFPGPVDWIASPSGNTGDGHNAAEAAGAWLARMDQANLNPAVPIRYDGRLQGLAMFFHREPNAIVVDRTGRRFFDETTFNLGEILDTRDGDTGAPLHLPAWLVTDADFLKRVPLVRWFSRHDRTWIRRASSLPQLAAQIGVPPANLEDTVSRFNEACGTGVDLEFGRRALAHSGNEGVGLAPIRRAPFLAIPFNRSFASTKGGPRTDADGRVLRPEGSVIAGLYCAGVAMANSFGTRGIGAGTTIGPNMTWGYICGTHLVHAQKLARAAGDLGRAEQPRRAIASRRT